MDEHAAAPHGLAPQILVVDDQHDAADNLARLLELVGYRTVVAYDGDSAVAAALQLHPAAAILDLHMPLVSGVQAASRIRQHANAATIRLIALTGSTQAADREAAELAGFDEFLVKPLMLAALLRVLPPLAHTHGHS
jgi:CheY-like chemotaxis protein